jgi:hypothetical protein
MAYPLFSYSPGPFHYAPYPEGSLRERQDNSKTGAREKDFVRYVNADFGVGICSSAATTASYPPLMSAASVPTAFYQDGSNKGTITMSEGTVHLAKPPRDLQSIIAYFYARK